jgi:hypothetical protein
MAILSAIIMAAGFTTPAVMADDVPHPSTMLLRVAQAPPQDPPPKGSSGSKKMPTEDGPSTRSIGSTEMPSQDPPSKGPSGGPKMPIGNGPPKSKGNKVMMPPQEPPPGGSGTWQTDSIKSLKGTKGY